MKNSVKSLLVAAAVTGLLGAVAMPAVAEDPKPATTDTKDKNSCSAKKKDAKAKKAAAKDKAASTAAKDKNSCKGANGCSSKDDKKN